ncbi:hypothetical protein F5Y12DRAFT_456317 [Xylaria sp. FL1777]|nr:hypothetical protein F5Y12DRAFT_456317 [Xylaria sp. FL1777]
MKASSISSEQDNTLDPYAPHSRQAGSISSSGSTQKYSTKAIPHLLSPTIEESPSPRIEASKPIHDYKEANQNDVSDLTLNTCPISSDTHGGHVQITGSETTIPRTVRSIGVRESEPPLSLSLVQQNRMLIDSCHDENLRNRRLSHSITDPNLRRGGNPTSIEPSDLGSAHSEGLDKTNPGNETLGSPVEQWRRLMASSKASTESLAKSAKARRLKRGSDYISSRPSRDASTPADARSTTPDWKRQLLRKKYEPKEQSTTTTPERQSILEDTSQSARLALEAHVKHGSSGKYSTCTPLRGASQRSTSKPIPGAVKAMAALFDKAVKESPDRSVVILSGRSRHSLGESTSFPCRNTLDESPTKSKPHQGSLASSNSVANSDEHPRQRKLAEALTPEKSPPTPRCGASIVRTASSRPVAEHTPARSLRSTLKPVKMFSSARKEPPQSQPNPPNPPTHETDRTTQPPRLGTMVPHEEEPPVGHFVRPSSATSAQSQHTRVVPPLDRAELRQISSSSSSSSLHARIRCLQRQLDARDDEILHLRRRLETQAHVDVGTLCEQLRVARREGLMWRRRAEAAERRVAVFQRFGDKFEFEAFKDGAADDGGDDNDYGNADDDDNRVVGYEYDCSYGYGYECGSSDRGKCVDYGAKLPDDNDNDDDGGDDGGSSSCSARTVSREAFNDRIRHSFAGKLRSAGGDRAVSGDCGQGTGDGGCGGDGDDDAEGEGGYRMRKGGPVEFWAAAQEVSLRRDDGVYLLGREHRSF